MKKTKWTIVAATLCAVAVWFSGCGAQGDKPETSTDPISTTAETTVAPASAFPVTITDKFGEEIVIEHAPSKVICFSPELVEIMYAIGAGDALYGRAGTCDYPEAALSVEVMGDLFNLNVESIVAAAPDLVLLSSMSNQESVKSLQDKGLTVLALDADSYFDGVYDYIEGVGLVFGKVAEAAALADQMKADLLEITDLVKDAEKPRAYFAVGVGDFDSTATGDTYLSQIMEMAGAVNVAKDGTMWMYSLEQLLLDDPDIILYGEMSSSEEVLKTGAGYKDLRAVTEGNIFAINDDIYYRQGPRLVDAVRELAEIFYPELFV